jgi:transcriptional regulator with XRE-family HTH domain
MAARRQQPFTDALRQAIAASGMSFKALERETGVLRQSLMKFMRGEQSLRLDVADKLASHFGLEVQRKNMKG